MSSAQEIFKNLFVLPYFFYWWYIKRTIFWTKFIWRTLLLIIDAFALGPMFRYLFAPYHQDRTLVGRLIGFVVRSLWICVGLVFTLISLVLLLFLLPIHLMWPLGFYFGVILANYFDISWQSQLSSITGIFISLSAIVIYIQCFLRQPKKTITELNLGKPKEIDYEILEQSFTSRLRKDWHQALKLASQDDNLDDLSYFLFLTLLKDRRNYPIFYRLNLNPKQVYQITKEREYNLKKSLLPLSELFQKQLQTAKKLGHQHLDSDVLLVTLVEYNKAIHDLFVELGVSPTEIEQTTAWIYNEIKKRDAWKYWLRNDFQLHGGYDRAWTSGWTSTLKNYSLNITNEVAQGRYPKMIGRKKEIEQIMQVLTRTTRNNVILLGPAGVGKTSLVYGIAQRMITGELAELKDKKVVSLDLAALMAGTSARGDFESRLKKILNESGRSRTILFIDEMAGIFQNAEGSEVLSTLLPYVSEGVVQCIGAVNFTDYHQFTEKNTTFTSFFQTVEIKEPNDSETLQILEGFCPHIEAQQKVTITFQALEAALKLSKQYIHDRVLPEKALDILDEAAVTAHRQKLGSVTEVQVGEVITLKTGVPVTKISETEKDKLLHLEEVLHERVIGQNEAVKVIANAMRRARVGLKDSHKPIARFLFLGPTGVGKTETCKVLARQYYGAEDNMVRLDMSEYQDSSSLTRLLGAPPGTKDFEVGGHLTEAVRRRPFSLILLDELEKAHSRILDVFLQVLDDGRLTDSSGRTISFQDSIIIATSNAQAVLIQEAVRRGVKGEELKMTVMQNLNQTFRPEFINRFDAVVVFEPLNMEAVLQITVLMLQEIREQLKVKEIGFEITPEALLQIAKLGYNPEFGARPLRRIIQEKIENRMAKEMLEGKVKAGEVYRVTEVV